MEEFLEWFPGVDPASAGAVLDFEAKALSATAQKIDPGAATCRIREARHTAEQYERLKPNDGQPLDVWRVELVIANYSGRTLDYLSAHLNVESDWPPCDHWDGPEGSYGELVVWTGPLMSIQDVGSVQPGEERREIEFVLAYHEEEPALGRWYIDYDFEAGAAAAGDGSEPPARGVGDTPSSRAPTRAQVAPGETCVGKEVGTACWMETENKPGCYLWNPSLARAETITWSGDCADGLAQGSGSLEWRYTDRDGKPATSSGTGKLRDGKSHGQWTERFASGNVYEGPYVDGKRNGHWTLRFAGGSVSEGPYVDGKQHGRWTSDWGDECYANGNAVPCQ